MDFEKLVKDTAANMTSVAKQVHGVKPVRILECWMCQGFGCADNGDKCFNCAGLGRVATDGGEV